MLMFMYVVDLAGKCTDDLDLICPEVKPWEGRLAKCLSDQLAEEAKKDYKGDNHVSADCKKELDAFLVDRSQNINKGLPLAEACKGVCTRTPRGRGERRVLLRQKKHWETATFRGLQNSEPSPYLS